MTFEPRSRGRQMIEQSVHRHSYLYLVLIALLMVVIVRQAPVDYTDGDTEHVLLTAQALLEHGTIKLDNYIAQAESAKVLEVNGHRYSYQPLGTSLFALPAVWVANLRGHDMADQASQASLQKDLAAMTVAASFVLMALVARYFVGTAASVLVAMAFTLGSSIASTMGAALWSHNLAIVFTLAALLLLVRDAQGRLHVRWAYLLGGLLFAAYLVRPTQLAGVVAVFGYLVIWRRSLLLRAALGFLLPLGLLLTFFWIEYGQVLPYYYQTGRLRSWPTPQRLYGLFLSPGRGLLIYNPFLILLLPGLIFSIRRLIGKPLFWLSIGWLALYGGAVSLWAYWWGGWSFGSRMLVDALPALLLLTLLIWQDMQTAASPRLRSLASVTFAVLALAGVFVNTVQGLYNPWTRTWNAWYDVTEDVGYRDEAYMFDWRYPQFLASPDLVQRRNTEYLLNERAPLGWGEAAGPASENLAFAGWYDFAIDGADPCRWSEGRQARVSFRSEPLPAGETGDIVVEITAGTHHTQTIPVLLNKEPLGVIDSRTHWEPETYLFRIDATQLRTSDQGRRVNELWFLIPGANSPASLDPQAEDPRILGLCLWELRVAPAATDN